MSNEKELTYAVSVAGYQIGKMLEKIAEVSNLSETQLLILLQTKEALLGKLNVELLQGLQHFNWVNRGRQQEWTNDNGEGGTAPRRPFFDNASCEGGDSRGGGKNAGEMGEHTESSPNER